MNIDTAIKILSMNVNHAFRLPLLPTSFVMWLMEYKLGVNLGKNGVHAGEVREIPLASGRDFASIFEKREPVLITDTVKDWPAFEKWTPEYLREALGDQEVSILTSTGESRNFLSSYWEKSMKLVKMREVIDHIFFEPPSDVRYYLWGYGGLKTLGPLEHDLSVPAVVDGRPLDREGSGPWIGHKGNITSLHYDLWHGMLAQISGNKRVVLFRPSESSKLYPSSPFGPRPISTELPTDCLQADPQTFPKLFEAERFEHILKPGEMIYIPPFWWHQVEALDNNISVPIRWEVRLSEQVHPGSFPLVYRHLVWPMRERVKRIGKKVGLTS